VAVKTIELTGIIRNVPDSSVVDGAAHELINLRPRDGALRPVGLKKGEVSILTDVRYIHVVSSSIKVYIGVLAGKINYSVHVDEEYISGAATEVDAALEMSFASLHNVLMVSDHVQTKTKILLFNLDTFAYTVYADQIDDTPFITIGKIASEADNGTSSSTCDTQSLGDTKIAEYMKMMNDKADLGLITGYVLVRCAWEMTDGSLIKYTIPELIQLSKIVQSQVLNSLYTVTTTFTAFKLQYKLEADNSWLTGFQSKYKNLIRGLNVYVTLPRSPETKEITINDGRRTYDTASLSEYLPEVQSESYFLLKQIPIDSLVANALTTISVDTVLDLDTKPQLGVDNFSHHKIYGKRLFSYNSRIFLGNTITTLYNGYPLTGMIKAASDAAVGAAYEVGIEYDIVLSSGKTARVFSGWKTMNAYNAITGEIEFHLQRNSEVVGSRRSAQGTDDYSYWGYPDSRAKQARLYVRKDGTIHLKLTVNLWPVLTQNFSYAKGYIIKGPLSTPSGLNPVSATYSDFNRVQSTELSNPFYFPAINSYRIGNSEILGLAANSIALSQGQFGEFPIYCFTTEGIWTLNIGSGELLINTITPLSREVCNNADSITMIDGGVVFSTSKGLYIISGNKPLEISDQTEGGYKGPLSGLLSYEDVTSNPNLYQISDYLCSASFLDYLKGAKIGFDYQLSEIIVSNPSKKYSWVFSLKYKVWFKISQVFEWFVSDYPVTFGFATINGAYKRFNMCEEDFNAGIPIHYESRPIKLSPGALKKVNRILVEARTRSSEDSPLVINLFGSTDGISWCLLSNGTTFRSCTPVLIGRSSFSCKLYALVIGGKVDQDAYFQTISIDYDERFVTKIR
jgi:hypothetical protein